MLNIVIPMAGRGSRFELAGYKDPKPLIGVHGKPMIQVVIENLAPTTEHRFIFLCLDEHLRSRRLKELLLSLCPNAEIIPVSQVTEGAACTVLLASPLIDTGNPLMIANCDQWIEVDIDVYLQQMDVQDIDGLIMTMKASDPKWSFVRFDDAGKICEVVEKKAISDEATVGIYNFRRGQDFVTAARSMITKNLRVNNEFYVAPVYNEMIHQGCNIGFFNVGGVSDGMHGLGTPDDLKHFLSLGKL